MFRAARVGEELTSQPVRSVEQAYDKAKTAAAVGSGPLYMQVAARTAVPRDDHIHRAKFSGEESIVTSTQVVHEYEDREVTQQQTRLWHGIATVNQSYGSWHKKYRLVDTQVRGKNLWLAGNNHGGDDSKDSKQPLARIPTDSGVLDETLSPDLYIEVAAPLLPTPTEGLAAAAQQNGGATAATASTGNSNGGSGAVVTVVNQNNMTAASESFRSIGYRHHEKIIRRNRPVVALGEWYLADPNDIRQAGGNTSEMKEPFLTLRVPTDSNQPFVLSCKTRNQLIRESEDASGSLKLTSFMLLGLGLGLGGVTGYYHHQSRQAGGGGGGGGGAPAPA